MELWCDVYDAAGQRLGDGPIRTLQNVTVNRALDGIGTITFAFPATDQRAGALLKPERRFRIHTLQNGARRELARGIVAKLNLAIASQSRNYVVTGPDALDELKRRSTWIARAYPETPLSVVIQDLIALVPGWTATVDEGVAEIVVNARFDGVSVLKAFQEIVKNYPVHFRLGDGNTVEVGAFGDLSPVKALNIEKAPTTTGSANRAIIDQIRIGQESEGICNRVVPLGAGEDAAALTLERSTRGIANGDRYAIRQMDGPDGRTLYYLEDADSLTNYGAFEKVATFPDIGPITNSELDIIAAANALYDAAATMVRRGSVIQESYDMRLIGVQRTLRPGDRMNVRYKGQVWRETDVYRYAEINQDMWLMKVTESVNLSGGSVNVEVSNVDQTRKSPVNEVIDTMERVEMRAVKPSVSTHPRTFVYKEQIIGGFGEPGAPARFNIPVTNTTQAIQRMLVTVQTSLADYHRHTLFQYFGPSDLASFEAQSFGAFLVNTLDNNGEIVVLPVGAAGDDGYLTGNSTTIPYDSGLYFAPKTLRVSLNGVDLTEALGGPWAVAVGDQDELVRFTLDVGVMTDAINAAPGGIQQEHELAISCDEGFGGVEVTIELYEVAQSIRVLPPDEPVT